MYDSNNSRELYDGFLDFEEGNNLLNITINNIKFWQIIRFGVFSDLKKKINNSGQAHTTKNKLPDKIRSLPGIIYNSFTKNPLFGKYNKEILIFDHPRKLKVNNNYIDIYTNDFINQKKFNNYQVIESPYQGKHYTNRKHSNIKYSDAIILNHIIKSHFFSYKILKNDLQKIIDIEELLKIKFDVNIDIVEKSKQAIEAFTYRYNYYIKLLRKRKTKVIYLVVSYNQQALIAAAKALKIKVIEFQHGLITSTHVAYNYPHITHEIDYFPNKILTFGEYWNKSAAFPKDVELEVYGFPYLKAQYDLYRDEKQNKNQILFLSQGPIGKELSELAYKVMQLLPNYTIVYKLHPGEYVGWKTTYPDLVKANQHDNFQIIDHNEKELYYYMAKSEYVAGVYSTAIFEGLVFNCKTILLNTHGIEFMEDLIKEKVVDVINDEKEFVKSLKNIKDNNFDENYFFK